MKLSPKHGYVGMYVVDKDYRGLGVGQQVWNAAQIHLGCRNKGLSAVAHLFELYRDKSGFSQVAEWTVDLYKLSDVSTVLRRYKQHQLSARKQMKRLSITPNSDCQNESLCHVCIGSYEKESKIYCLAPSLPKKSRKRMKNPSAIEFSDDESYGFSNLFFEEQQSNDEFSDLDEDSYDAYAKTEESNKVNSLEDVKIKKDDGTFLKPISYCFDGKLRTVHVNGLDSRYLTDEIVEYDKKLHSYDRSKIVRATLAERDCLVRVALLGRTVVGYGAVKPNLQNMWIVSPLYCDNEHIAKMLLMDLVTDVVIYQKYNPDENFDSAIVLKVPSNNPSAARMLHKLDFVKQDYTLRRCYTKKIFETPNQNIYALHTSVFCTE